MLARTHSTIDAVVAPGVNIFATPSFSSSGISAAGEAATDVLATAMRVCGGAAYRKEVAVERYFRDARVTTLYEGTSQIQRLVIARELLREAGSGRAPI